MTLPRLALHRWGAWVTLGWCAIASTAWAHARLVRSEPRDQAVLEESPDVVHLWFNELLDRGFHQVAIFPSTERTAKRRSNLTRGEPQVDPDDRTHLSVRVQPLPPGEYVIEYRVLSRDGHTAPGRILFRVRPPSGASH